MDMSKLFEGYPQTKSMSYGFKLYLLFQISFWFHMVFVTVVEPRQRDFWLMLAHHAITITMLVGAYSVGLLRFTHAVLVEQDFADMILPARPLPLSVFLFIPFRSVSCVASLHHLIVH